MININNKKELYYSYIIERKSTREIAAISGFSQWTVRDRLKKFQIKARSYKENKMPTKKGAAIAWDTKSHTKEANQKRSNTLKGRYIQRKGTHPPVAVECHNCEIAIRKKYSYWVASKSKNFYCSKCNPTKFKNGDIPHNKKEKIIFKCDYCGGKLERSEAQFKAYKYHFCNAQCNGLWKAENITGDKVYNFSGGYAPYYGDNWRTQRRECIKRDDNTCQVCKLTRNKDNSNMDVDHKIPFRVFEDYLVANRLSNLWCLCKSCHSVKTNWQHQYKNINIGAWKEIVEDLIQRKCIWQIEEK